MRLLCKTAITGECEHHNSMSVSNLWKLERVKGIEPSRGKRLPSSIYISSANIGANKSRKFSEADYAHRLGFRSGATPVTGAKQEPATASTTTSLPGQTGAPSGLPVKQYPPPERQSVAPAVRRACRRHFYNPFAPRTKIYHVLAYLYAHPYEWIRREKLEEVGRGCVVHSLIDKLRERNLGHFDNHKDYDENGVVEASFYRFRPYTDPDED
jgi:hypothetical protein